MTTPRKLSLLLMLILAQLNLAAGEGESLPEDGYGIVTENPLTPGERPSFELDVKPEQNQSGAGQAIYVIKARLKASEDLLGRIGQLDLWWTTPSGARTRLEMRPFSDGIWVSHLAVESQEGIHGLTLVAILSGEGGSNSNDPGIGEVWEDACQLEMPSMELKQINQRRISEWEGNESPALEEWVIDPEDGVSRSRGASIALVAMMIGLANVLVLVLLGLVRLFMDRFLKLFHHIRGNGDPRVPVRETMRQIFDQGRLFEIYEDPLIDENAGKESKMPAGGRLKGLFDKVLSKDANDGDPEKSADPQVGEAANDDEIQVNLNDLSF